MTTRATAAPRVPAYPDGRGGLRAGCPWRDRWPLPADLVRVQARR